MGVAENCGSKATVASLAAMHVELVDKLKCSNNVIVSGLPPSTNGIPDADLFSNLCEEHLSVKPRFKRDSCQRLGKPLPSRV